MPTRHQRIPVTNDPELADALSRTARHFEGAPTARIVHDLAVRGAKAIEREEHERHGAIERLVAISTSPTGLDWDVLEDVRDVAWGE
jgi:hypothetical protein